MSDTRVIEHEGLGYEVVFIMLQREPDPTLVENVALIGEVTDEVQKLTQLISQSMNPLPMVYTTT